MADTASDKDLLAFEGERVLAAARDSLSDEMITRLAGTAADAMDLIDRVNRTGLYRAIPAIAELVNNGDLDRLAKLARVYASAEDALTDDMVNRLAETAAEGFLLLDKLNRGGAGRLVEMLARLEASGSLKRIAETLPKLLERLEVLDAILHALEQASIAAAGEPKPSGGFGSLWKVVTDAETQDALRFLVRASKAVRAAATSR
jgi:uncharacterized protein YjgD (DUF1641 family)